MEKKSKQSSFRKSKIIIALLVWLFVLSPAIGIFFFVNLANDDSLPDITELENPKTDLASVIISSDL